MIAIYYFFFFGFSDLNFFRRKKRDRIEQHKFVFVFFAVRINSKYRKVLFANTNVFVFSQLIRFDFTKWVDNKYLVKFWCAGRRRFSFPVKK